MFPLSHPSVAGRSRLDRTPYATLTCAWWFSVARWLLSGQAQRVATFVIRPAVRADMDALGDVFRRSSISNDGDRLNLLAHPEVLEMSDLGIRQGRTRVAVADHVIAGFATWLAAGDAVEIEDLFVDPDWMRQGAGRALVLDLIAIARSRAASRIEVTANQHALAFYAKAGFVAAGHAETRFGPAPRMHLDLTP